MTSTQSTTTEIEQLAADTARLAAPVFAAAGWTYHDDTSTPPDEGRLRETILRLLRRVEELAPEHPDKLTAVASGRFTAYREPDGAEVVWGVDLDLGTFYKERYP